MSQVRSRSRHSAKARVEHINQSHVEYEFGGPTGAAGIIMLLPATVYFLYFAASKDYHFNVTNYADLRLHLPSALSEVWNWQAFGIILAWFAFNVILERTLVHTKATGVILKSGKQLTYRISGHLQFWVVLLVLCHGYPKFNSNGQFVALTSFPLSWLYDHYIQLASGAILFSTFFSMYLFLRSFYIPTNELAVGGATGNFVYDFFIGRELNPRLMNDFDLKEFCELRPGLIGWVVLVLSCVAKQYELQGMVSVPLVLVTVFQGLYVFDALYNEQSILTTMDITTDGFGFMLVFGDLVWVPFTYSLQARYLVENNPELSNSALLVISALNFLGYMIFRGSNSQKDAFRRDPKSTEVTYLATMTTKTGRNLLVGGWWGLARKINYTGDWLMALAWCLLTGFGCIVTYFYCIYFFILLVHRAFRDDHACGLKYGSDWKMYKQKVPYMFIPRII